MENIKITLPQIPSLKIVLPGQGGTPITVDSEMSDTSENPVENRVVKGYVDNGLLPKLEFWESGKVYKAGTIVLAEALIDTDCQTVGMFCLTEHLSTEIEVDIERRVWEVFGIYARRAVKDANGKIIHETYATKEEIENFTSNEKVYDYSSETTNDLILEHNSLYYFGVLTTLSLAISSDVNIESVDVPFECSIMFTSGETATNLDYSASPIIWSGDDCDSDGHFVPEANKTYEISIKKFGLTISARVGVI